MQEILTWLGDYMWITAFVLGAIHALQPGHGKTIVAAYLIGSKGTIKDAILLGIVVTITHTLIIYVLAALAQGGMLLMPLEEIEPYLGGLASILIIAVGLSLIWGLTRQQRLRKNHAHAHAHGHAHAHIHEHGHSHSHSHTHEEHVHIPGLPHHHPKPEEMTSLSRIFMLGISGGIVPCPEGLAVFLASVAGGQLGTGVLLVVIFSLGLASTLVVVGILFIKVSHRFKDSPSAGVWGMRVSWISAVLITLVGIIYLGKYALSYQGA